MYLLEYKINKTLDVIGFRKDILNRTTFEEQIAAIIYYMDFIKWKIHELGMFLHASDLSTQHADVGGL